MYPIPAMQGNATGAVTYMPKRQRKETQGCHRRLHDDDAHHAQRHDEGRDKVERNAGIGLTVKKVTDRVTEVRDSKLPFL